jgi:hypothetical protein
MRDNISEALDRTCAGRVLPKRDVSSHLIIIGHNRSHISQEFAEGAQR